MKCLGPGCSVEITKKNKKYCCPRCKKNYENSQRSAPKNNNNGQNGDGIKPPSTDVKRPQWLNEIAAEYWDRIAPTVIGRGHLNVLSADGFAELCDLYSRLQDINTMINNGTIQQCDACGHEMKMPANRALLQIDDKWAIKDGTETACLKESAISDLKRKYSRLFLDYQKQFYLTPVSNRGNFGIEKPEENNKKDNKKRFFE